MDIDMLRRASVLSREIDMTEKLVESMTKERAKQVADNLWSSSADIFQSVFAADLPPDLLAMVEHQTDEIRRYFSERLSQLKSEFKAL
jgi:hypothetical protein